MKKRRLFVPLVLILLLVLVNLASVSAETYPCCCEYMDMMGYTNIDPMITCSDYRQVEKGECSSYCQEIIDWLNFLTPGRAELLSSVEGKICAGWYSFGDEPPVYHGCVPEEIISGEEEICNGVDDDEDGLVDEDESAPYEIFYVSDGDCYGNCPLGYVCEESELVAMAGEIARGISGMAGKGEKACKKEKSSCDEPCPPYPPGAIEKNLLGICAPESQGGYPYSKNCLDWKNRVSCGTCVDENKNPEDGREKFKPRENDGSFGVDMNNKPIFREGDKVECSVDGCTFPKIDKPENNKDYQKDDKVIDCRLVIPVITSNLPEGDVMSEKLALTGVCGTFESGGDILCRPRPLSSCMTDCYWEYEVGWKSWTKKLSEDDMKEGDGDDIMLTEQCPDDPKNSKNARTNLAMKKEGSWGQLLSENGADCAIKYKSWWYTKCASLNGEILNEKNNDAKKQPFPTEELQKKCIEYVKVEGGNEKNAYFWSMLKGTKTDCFCKKADIELKVWPDKKSYALFELRSKTEMACANPNSFNCPLAVISVLQDRNAPQDEITSAFDSLKKWIKGV
ncbi:hypothetical protein COV15_03405 [Candidatus Woesearchaeota archaeon CG10_big_fil_rev_8_21_14_0_10_34_12]|nr:MAG: hypothetical protein COV15_03405 [Candidatus Woesearchaeota archaeon CG10_big_fil_rev_8_21_14_0_10_34_12]